MPGPDKNLKRDLTPGKTPVRLAGYLSYKDGDDIGNNVRVIAEKGFHAAIAGVDPWNSARDSVVRELKSALKQHDVVIFEVGGYRNLLHTDEKIRRENCKHIARCLETAEKIGCPMVGTISGSRNPEGNQYGDNYAVHPDNWTMDTWNLLLKSLRQILEDTVGIKAAIGMEAQVTTNIDGPLSHKRLMEDMGNDRVKVNLDPTNMVHLHNHFHTTELINECFDLLGEDIFGCHAKDTYVLPHSQTVHVQEVCPGRGNLDYETYLVRLSHMKWARALLPEHIPADQFDEAYAYIRKVAAKVGVKIYGA
jgi:sugar phosphate isomerase/epimerase